MDKAALLELNRVPAGVPAWLDYKAFRTLQTLFEGLPAPSETDGLGEEGYLRLHDFLVEIAGLAVPETQASVHLNAFTLIRRGYRAEELTKAEFKGLQELLEGTEAPDPDDLERAEFGAQRALSAFLTAELNVYVEPGRGPVWQRANELVRQHELRRANRS